MSNKRPVLRNGRYNIANLAAWYQWSNFCKPNEKEAELLASKVANLRIFCDEADKMNLSLLDTDGEALVISNFTLCADSKKGNRPSFINAKEPVEANALYEKFCLFLKENGVKKVAKGIFLVAPYNVDIMGDLLDELENSGVIF